MENEMPARPRCSEGAAGVCLSEKQRWTHMIDFLTFPGPCSRQSARKAAVTQRKKMVLIDLLDSIGVQSVDLEGSKKCSSAPLPRTSIITDGWAIWALTRTKEDRMCQKKKRADGKQHLARDGFLFVMLTSWHFLSAFRDSRFQSWADAWHLPQRRAGSEMKQLHRTSHNLSNACRRLNVDHAHL